MEEGAFGVVVVAAIEGEAVLLVLVLVGKLVLFFFLPGFYPNLEAIEAEHFQRWRVRSAHTHTYTHTHTLTQWNIRTQVGEWQSGQRAPAWLPAWQSVCLTMDVACVALVGMGKKRNPSMAWIGLSHEWKKKKHWRGRNKGNNVNSEPALCTECQSRRWRERARDEKRSTYGWVSSLCCPLHCLLTLGKCEEKWMEVTNFEFFPGRALFPVF